MELELFQEDILQEIFLQVFQRKSIFQHSEFSLGVYIARYVDLTAQVNITRCDGVVCPAATQVHKLLLKKDSDSFL